MVEVPVPVIGQGELLLKVKAAAVCGTDVRMIDNGAAGASEEKPLTLGHEFAGVIEKVGEGVADIWKPGLSVSVAPNFGCGTCDFCVSGNGHLCQTYQAFGINIDGGFAEYVRIPEKTVLQGNVAPIPEGVSFAAAALNEPLSCVFNGFERNRVSPGDAVLVIGAGAIGIMHAMLAVMAGASPVVLNDLSTERLELAKKILPHVVTVDGTVDLKVFTKEITGGKGFDAIVTAAPVPKIQQDSLELAAVNGRICFFGGLPKDREQVALNTNLIHYKQLIVSGTTRASLAQFRQTLRFVAAGTVPSDSLITSRKPIEFLPELVSLARQAAGLKHVVVF